MTVPITCVSFLVRLWREGSPELPEPTADWRSEVEHIQTGWRWTFGTLEELPALLRRQAEAPKALDWPAGE